MFEPDGSIGGLDNRTTSDKTMNTVSDNEKRHKRHSKGNSNNGADEDSDNECWDDAKALLQTNESNKNIRNALTEGVDSLDLSDSNQYYRQTPTSTSTDTVDSPAASTSSTYSSFQSNASHQPSATIASNTKTTKTTTTTTTTISSSSLFPLGDEWILHEAVFNNDIEKIFTILNDAELVKRLELVNKRDRHGNTALHLACMMGRSNTIVGALINNQYNFKWSIDAKNLNRWTPFHEACSYGDREVIKLLSRQLRIDLDRVLHDYDFKNSLKKTKDYRMTLRWEFQSWLPLLSRVMPSDVCVIIKQGGNVRIESKLLDMSNLFNKNGQICVVYADGNWICMDNKTKVYHVLKVPQKCHDIEQEVDRFMSTDIMDMELKSSEMQLTRSTSGWIWKADRVGKVGKFHAAMYDLNNVFLITKKRREHLSEEDLKRNKNVYRNTMNFIKFGTTKPNPQQDDDTSSVEQPISVDCKNGNNRDENVDEPDDEDESIAHRESLPRPQPAAVSWQQYLLAEPGNHPTLGREQKCKVVKTAVKASVAMSEEFPLSKEEFLDVLKIAPIKLFKKLNEFVQLKLPNGFPVRFDIPVFPFLTARITFEDFAFHEGPVQESLFEVPNGYRNNASMLSNLFYMT